MNLSFQNLISLTEPAVIAILNREDRYAYVSHSINPMKHLSVLMRDVSQNINGKYKQMRVDIDKLEIVLIQSTNDIIQRNNQVDKYVEGIKSQGFKLYNKSNGVKYRIRHDIHNNGRVYLKLVNRRNDQIIIGVFDNLIQSKEFENQYYSDMSEFYTVMSTNELSKGFFRKLSRTLL